MGYDLVGYKGNGTQVLTSDDWFDLLHVARLYGWQPAGTDKPPLFSTIDGRSIQANEPGIDAVSTSPDEERDWDGSYAGNNWQRVTDADARAFGKALLCAANDLALQLGVTIAELPAFDRNRARALWKNRVRPGEPLGVVSNPMWLADVARFAIRGGFLIG